MTQNRTLVNWSILFLLAIIWGSSFILIKKGMVAFTPLQVSAMRMFISFVILFPFVIFRLREVQRRHWPGIFVSGYFGNGIPGLLFAVAQTHIASSVAGIMNALTPLFTLLVGVLFFRNKFSLLHLFGIILGLGGAAGILWAGSNGRLQGAGGFELFAIAASCCYAISMNTIKVQLHDLDSLLISGFAMCTIGPVSGVYLLSSDFLSRMSSHPEAWSSLGYLLMLSVFGSTFALILFNRLIKTAGTLFTASVTYLMPIVALSWGFFDDESLALFHIVGLASILSGVYLVNKKSG